MSPGLDMTDVSSAPAMPSPDLRDMATLQLGMLYQLLSMAGTNYSSMRCTVYARTFMDVGPGQVKLVRVAKFPVAPGQGDDLLTAQQSTLLLHTEQSWALQGGSAAVDPSGLIEDCLLHREVVALPHSSALVFPLVDSGVLVGLLVVELDAAAAGAGAGAGGHPHQQAAGAGAGSAQPVVDAAFASIPALAAGGAAAMLPKLCLAQEAAAAGRGGAGGSGISGVQECGVEGLLDDDVEGGRAKAGHPRNLTDEELRCLRLAVPLLAKACGMDARASWQVAQSSLTAAAARGLLREAQRPLSTLNTFGSMLVPRLKDGEPDKDMAKGILLQGRRLQDLVWQLEEALHGPSPQAAAAAAAAAGMPVATGGPALSAGSLAGGVALGRGVGAPGVAAGLGSGLASPFRSPVALPLDQSPAVQELLQLPPPRPVALPPRAAPDELAAPAVDIAAPQALASPPPVHPGRVTYAEPATPSSTLEPSSSAPGLAPFTIRQPAAARAAVRPGAPPAGPGAAMATIDVETDSGTSSTTSPDGACGASGAGRTDSSSPGSPRAGALVAIERSGGGSGAGGPSASGPFSWAQGSGVSTNLVAALAGVLTAACRLAAVSGIGFIVNSPLSAVLPRRSTGKPRPGSGSGSAADGAALGAAGDRAPRAQRPSSSAAAAAADLDSVVEGPRLIPRPARPLLVGVRAALVAKIVGYMLDICLQSTPRGGQLCVSARQDGAGVQLLLLHTGRMDLQRLHMRSRSLMAATTAPAAAAAAAAVPVMAAAAARGGGHAAVAAAGSGRGSAAQPSVTTTAGAGGAQAGSGVLSVELAQELAQQAGGHLTVSYPCNMVNAGSGSLDLGTSVEIWLPGPGALN
ncbi:hypothetical protein HXX76_004590 [Chlamydomonas incerta]|uniref:Uncharacterized protein n=1 Tax=Chlamydomonas incerta TaxID=51695 RepID=A0A835W6K4_CHLIN|nr:hypothetical protein HXX76_004590 [Chlamydomonas incerta]|eukprot:KAG2439228.1 hypothetical protein HXX76_004590 [Chlamydomonas incerta]